MNEKLKIQDLTDLLAAKHGMPKKDAEAFVKEFFLLIEQALVGDKTVNIKGLGTFELIDIDSRKNVDSNTDERFQNKGHAKVSFSPDENLRDIINKPFAHFETVVLNDNTILEDTPIEETLSKAADTAEKEQATEQPIEAETMVEETVVVETTTVEEKAEQPLAETNNEDKVEQEEFEKEETLAVEPCRQQEQQVKSPVPYLTAVIIFALLLCGGVILFIYYPDLFSSSSNKNTLDTQPMSTRPIQPEAQLSDTIEHEDTMKEIMLGMPTVVAKKEKVGALVETENKVVQQQSSTSDYLDSVPYKIVGTKTKYTIKEGETLRRISLRFYGTKAMWPYIVEHNPGIIKNPDKVPYGIRIKIPELAKE